MMINLWNLQLPVHTQAGRLYIDLWSSLTRQSLAQASHGNCLSEECCVHLEREVASSKATCGSSHVKLLDPPQSTVCLSTYGRGSEDPDGAGDQDCGQPGSGREQCFSVQKEASDLECVCVVCEEHESQRWIDWLQKQGGRMRWWFVLSERRELASSWI